MKKGQLTLFVVLGLVLIIIIALFLLLKPKSVNPDFTNEDVLAVQQLVQSCIDSSLEQLLREAGGNGGYIDTSFLRGSAFDYNADYITFEPQKIAYWYHMKPCTESSIGCLATEKPPLCREGAPSCPVTSYGDRSIQEQIETILPSRVDKCINNFESLKERFEVQQLKAAEAELIFSDITLVEYHMPIEITVIDSGKKVKLEDFKGTANLDMGKVYNMANLLAIREEQTQFLESLTLHLMSIYSGIDTPLPPTRHVSLMGQKHYWVRSEVEEIFRYELLPWTSFIQVVDATAGYVPIMVTEKQAQGMSEQEQMLYAGIYHYLTVKLSEENGTYYDDLAINFYYPYSDIKLRINGGQELLKPRSADTDNFLQKILGVFMNDYRFRYDLSYPIIANIKDVSAFDGRGYTFSIGLEPNIYHNEAVKGNTSVNNLLLINNEVDFSSPQHLVDNLIVVDTKNKLTGEPLEDVSISYRCGADHYIASTGTNGQLMTKLPYCRYGGVILFNKEGYMGDGLYYDNYDEGVKKTFEMSLWPLETKDVKVMKKSSTGTIVPLGEEDIVVFMIKRHLENEFQEEVPLIGVYSYSNQLQVFKAEQNDKMDEIQNLVEQGVLLQEDADDYSTSLNDTTQIEPVNINEIEFVPGDYDVEAYLIFNGNVSIPEEKRTYGSWPMKKTVTLNATNFTSWVSGGIRLLDDKAITIDKDMIYNDQALVFYALEQKIPSTWTELENYEAPEDFLLGKESMQYPTLE